MERVSDGSKNGASAWPRHFVYSARVELEVPGGPTVHTQNMVSGLDALGIDVILLAPRPRRSIDPFLGERAHFVPFFGWTPVRLLLHEVLLALSIAWVLVRRPGAVLYHRDNGLNVLPVLIAKLLRRSTILEMNGVYSRDFENESRPSRWRTRLRKWELAQWSGITMTGNALRNRYCRAFGLDRERTRVVTMNVDTSKFRPLDRAECRDRLGLPPTALVIGYVGSFQPTHDTTILLDALELLTDDPVDARLLIVGEGGTSGAFDAEIARRGLESRVDRRGFLPHEEVPGVIGALDVASGITTAERAEDSEALLKIKEYLACGVPTLVHAGGIAGFDGYPENAVFGVDVDASPRGSDLARIVRDVSRDPVPSGLADAVAAQFELERAARETLELFATVAPAAEPAPTSSSTPTATGRAS